MSDAVRHFLENFESLSESDKQSAIVEVLRRSPFEKGDLSEAQLDVLANELFVALDAEEAARSPMGPGPA